MSARTDKQLVAALSGGIGGAKLALGLARVLPPGDLLVVDLLDVGARESGGHGKC